MRGLLKNISQSLGFAVKQPDGKLKFTQAADFYQQNLDNAIMGIASGAFDYNTVIKKVISDMTNSGLRTVDYATGWSNRADVAARRSVMTGLSQLTAKMNEDNAKELGTDYFEVTWHSGARPSHQEWQGKVYSKKELETICGLGTVTGLCGANCYHDYYPFIPGISERSYTDEELAQMNAEENKPVKYGDKEYTKYEALQRQRKLETAMRAQRQKIHLLEEAGADEEDIINARCRYRGTSQEYTRFSKAMGLPQQRERVNADGLGNIGVGKTKIDLTQKDYSDIIDMKGKMSDIDVRKWYRHHNKNIPQLIDKSKSIEEQARQACALRNLDYDLIITGRQAIDGDTAQVGPQIAEHLGLPVISYAEDIKVEGDSVVVKRQYEDRYHVVKAKMPCLITALSELNEPRYMTPGGIFDAFDKEVTVWGRADLKDVDDSDLGLKGSPTKIAKASDKVPKGAGEKVNLDPTESVNYLMEKFKEKHII